MSNIGCLMSAWSWLWTLNRKYTKISSEPERKANTVYFGVYSIVITLIVGGLFVLGAWGIAALLGSDIDGLSEIVVWVLAAIVAVAELVLFAEYIFGGALGVYYQLRCNRRAVGWVALGIYIVASVGMVVGIVFIANSIV